MTTQTYTPEIGTISHGTMQPRDLIPAFASELEAVLDHQADPDPDHVALVAEANKLDSDEDYETDDVYFLLDDLFDALDSYAPDGCYFGAHEGDGSDYGFWPTDDYEEGKEE